MKTAKELLDDFLDELNLPNRYTITITERAPKDGAKSNWDIRISNLPLGYLSAQNEIEKRFYDAFSIIDWSDVTEKDGAWRRIAKFS